MEVIGQEKLRNEIIKINESVRNMYLGNGGLVKLDNVKAMIEATREYGIYH